MTTTHRQHAAPSSAYASRPPHAAEQGTPRFPRVKTLRASIPTAATSVVLDPNHSIPLIDRAHTTLSIGSSN